MTLAEYVKTTRRRNADTFPALVSQYEALFLKVHAESFKPVRELPLKFAVINSLNKRSQLIELSDGHWLIHDQYLGQTLNALTRLYFMSNKPDSAHPFAFRLLSEAASCRGRAELATYFAYVYSVTYHASKDSTGAEDAQKVALRQASVHVQEAFVLAHELAHLMWEPAALDPASIDMLLDSLMDVEGSDDWDEIVETYLDDLSFQFHGRPIPHWANINTDEERAQDKIVREDIKAKLIKDCDDEALMRAALKAEPRFREEVFVDWMAAQTCLKLFRDDMDHVDLALAIHLALENITTISFVSNFDPEGLEGESSSETLAVAARKRALREVLRFWLLEVRPESPELGHRVLTEANKRYMHFVRDPITLDALSRVRVDTMPGKDDLADMRQQIVRSIPEAIDPQFIIRERPFKQAAGAGASS